MVGDEIALTSERKKVDAAAGTLIGSKCSECGTTSWPSRAVCEKCGSVTDMSYALPREGALLSCTTVWVSRPGLPAPYTLGQVTVDGSVFFGHVRGIREDAVMPVDVVVRVGADTADVLFWFEPSPV